MHYSKTIILLIFSLSGILKAQTSTEIRGPGASISISPLALIDFYSGSSVRVGTEWRLAGKNSVYGEVGYYLPQSPFTRQRAVKGVSFRGEIKRYIAVGEKGNRGQNRMNHYLSASYFYKYQAYMQPDTFANQEERYYATTKNVHALTFRYGAVLEGKRLLWEGYAGLGVRHKNTVLGLTQMEQEERVNYNTIMSESLSQMETHSYWPNIELGMGLGIKLF